MMKGCKKFNIATGWGKGQFMSKDTSIREFTVGSANSKEELIKALHQIKTFVPKEFRSNNSHVNQIVIDFIVII